MPSAQLETAPGLSAAASIVTLAASGLQQMLDPEHQLFCFKLRQGPAGLVREGISHRYTMMTLLGLHRFEKAGQPSPVATSPILNRLVADMSWIESTGDLGLLLWTCAVLAPERVAFVAEKMKVRDALTRYQDARTGSTMELAWFLTGLSYCVETDPRSFSNLREEADKTFRALAANQGSKGIFRHLARQKSMTSILRGSIGSFADQVYPIHALAKFSSLTGSREAMERASACAESICEHQGPKGEWWWHYDSASGEIAETYPVYSVHQDGMAPMALFALAEVTGADFSGPIQKGLNWVCGNNDLNFDMRSESDHLVWRNFYLPNPTRYWRHVVGTASRPATTPVQKLRVNSECRPYELGWALHALAGK